jgi:aromatic-L-amino-acid decarboxylase
MDSAFHMTIEEFKKYGYKLIDFIAAYHENIENLKVTSDTKFGDILSELPLEAPDKGQKFDEIIKDLQQIIVPGLTHWQSPNFFAYFPSNTSFPSILGELVSAGFGVQGMLWATSPACTELEIRLLDWLVPMLGLPEKFLSTKAGGGVIQDSASSAILCAIIAAREKATELASNKKGCRQNLIAYLSDHTHSSAVKGLKIAGIGEENIRYIKSDNKYAMDAKELYKQISKDRSNNNIPFFVCSTIGTTSTNAIDPVEEIGKICQREVLWHHVDAAMAGTAAICPEYRYLNKGVELANSYCFNPHKWMFTNFDCDCFYVDDKRALIQALTITPEYLKTENGANKDIVNYRDWQIPLGRRFRSLKLWFVIRHYGINGLQFHIRKHIKLAEIFESFINADKNFELTAERPLNLVCFRFKKDNNFNRRLLDEINKSGNIFLSHTVINDTFMLRLCVGQTYTEEYHILTAWDIIKTTAENLSKAEK